MIKARPSAFGILAALGCIWSTAMFLPASQNAPAAQTARATGDVTQVQPGHIAIRTDKGEIQVEVPDSAKILRVPPGAKDLKSASPIAVSEITPGDRAVVLGHVESDQRTIEAVRVVLMTKADISSLHQAEVRDWQTRGIEGVVKTVDPAALAITLSVPNRPPTPGNLTHPVILTATAKTAVLRYAPDSTKFADAKPSSIDAIKAGDQLRALGTKSEDGSHYAAEKMVFGTFHNIGATVLSVDQSANTLTVKNLTNNKQMLVHVGADCKMHQLPQFIAQMIARLSTGAPAGAPGAGGETSGGPSGEAQPPGGSAGPGGAGGPGGGGGGMHRGMGNLSQALDNMPVVTLAEIKRGEPVVIFSSEGESPSEVTAIYILTGVEPILAAQPKGGGEMNLGAWNLSLGGGGAAGGEGGP